MQEKTAELAQHKGESDYYGKIKTWLNLGHKYAAEAYDFWSELQSRYRFVSEDGKERYYLPSDFDKPYRLYDLTHNNKLRWSVLENYYDSNTANVADDEDRILQNTDELDLENTDEASLEDTFERVTGTPDTAILYGVSAIGRDKYSSFTVKAKSSSSSDSTGIVVRLEVWLDSAKTILGYINLTLNTASPTTYVTESSPTTIYGITRIVKSADTAGFITVADNSSNVLATIAPSDRESRYPILHLELIPNSANVYKMLYKRKVKKLVDDNDYPFADLGDFLILYATGYAFQQEKEAETRAATMWQKADALLMSSIRNEQLKNGTDYQHKMITTTSQSHRF